MKNLDLDRSAQIARVITAPRYRAIRTGRYMLAKYGDGGRELYDLQKDRLEVNSFYKNGRYAAVRKFLLKKLAKLSPCGVRLQRGDRQAAEAAAEAEEEGEEEGSIVRGSEGATRLVVGVGSADGREAERRGGSGSSSPATRSASPRSRTAPGGFLEALGRRDDWEELRVYGALLLVGTELFNHPNVHYLSGFFGPIERALRDAGANISFVPADFRRFAPCWRSSTHG